MAELSLQWTEVQKDFIGNDSKCVKFNALIAYMLILSLLSLFELCKMGVQL